MKITNYTILLLLLCAGSVFGQQRLTEEYETLLLEEEESTEGLAFKPVIGAGMGSFSFYGDVNDYFRTPLNGLTSYRVSISRNISKNFDIEFQGTFGNVSGNKYDGDSTNTLNFKTSVFLGGVSMYYNFNHLLKRQRPIHPYFSLGVEILQFAPFGDMKDGFDNEYHYWSDGTIRDVEQGVNGGGNLINRDYEYETDLRGLNDQYYSKTSFAIPIDVGVNVTVSDRVRCRLGATFHMSMTDYIDDLSAKGTGLSNDIILNTYVALTIDLFSPADELVAVDNFRSLKFTITDREDQDGDGIDDFNDECPDTPEIGVKVNYKGCPEDVDNDGVPDYLDKQNNTPSGTIGVGANGISLAETQLIMLLYDPDAVKRSEIKLYSKTSEASSTEGGRKGIPDKFKPVDVNGDNYISHEELNNAIDGIFEGTSTLTPGDIYQLQEFFFSQ